MTFPEVAGCGYPNHMCRVRHPIEPDIKFSWRRSGGIPETNS